MNRTDTQTELRPWEPTRQELPPAWKQLGQHLTARLVGAPGRQYILDCVYDGERVSELLHTWGLDWPVVLAGQLWDCNRNAIYKAALPDCERVLRIIQEADRYKQYIEDDMLHLLTPPYEDLGGLLIAVAMYYTALQTLLVREQPSNTSKIRNLRGKIERIRATLLHITKRLGMWKLKREIADCCAAILEPRKFAEDQAEHTLILTQDRARLLAARDHLAKHYEQATGQQATIFYTACGISGLHRRYQDAHTTITTQKTQLTGFDLVTFDIIVPTVPQCYAAFGIFSQLGYIQDRVTDHIAHPKSNGYSAIALGLTIDLHHSFTQSFQVDDAEMITCQIQIGTHMMQAITCYGCLHPRCYPLYQLHTASLPLPSTQESWQGAEGKTLSAIQEAITIESHYLEATLRETNAGEEKPIIVYDQNGHPVSLSRGATALDFAHSRNIPIGRDTEAFINNRKAPLHRILDMGDMVEIRLSREPSQSAYLWQREGYAIEEDSTIPQLEPRNRENVQQYSVDHTSNSYTRLYKMVSEYYANLKSEELDEELYKLLKEHNLSSLDAYLEHLNNNEAAPSSPYTLEWTTHQIVQQITDRKDAARKEYRWFLTENATSQRRFFPQKFCSTCCRNHQPTYPDAVVGLQHTKKKQLVIHHPNCPHLTYSDSQKTPRILLEWQYLRVFRVVFHIEAIDRRGLIHDLTKQLLHYQCLLRTTHAEAPEKSKRAIIRCTIETYDEQELVHIRESILQVESVKSVDLDPLYTPTHIYQQVQTLIQQHKTEQEPTSEDSAAAAKSPQRPRRLRNDFDISHPASAKMFFGREQEIKFMDSELCANERGGAILLFGPRRSGKTSLCTNFLERHVRPPFVSVYHSLQNNAEDNEHTILRKLASEIQQAFQKQLHLPAPFPAWQDGSDSDAETHFKRILHECLAANTHSRLVLVLDEFGGVLDSFKNGHLEERFFTYWRHLIAEIPQLSLILVLPTSALHTLLTKVPPGALGFAIAHTVPFLDVESSRRLLVDTLEAQNIRVEPDVPGLAFGITAGNPYFMTLLGKLLVKQLNDNPFESHVTVRHLQNVIDELVFGKTHNHHFDFYRKEVLNQHEMHILEKMVEHSIITKANRISLKEMARRLGYKGPLHSLRSILERMRDGLLLVELEELEKHGKTRTNPSYAFKIELVRRRMMHHHSDFTLSQETR
jgi:(p)ppGpp synthase/HD superfamily hydrolase